MKQIIILILSVIMCNNMTAQTSAVKNAARSVFTLTTFKADGSLLASSHGVFVGENGEAVSDLQPFLGASKAVVIDAKGNKMNVSRILGVNDLYDVARFKVDGKTVPANVATKPLSDGAQAWLLQYSVGSKLAAISAKVKSVEKFMDKYSYYIFEMSAPDNATACPFVNDTGEIIGLMQPATTSKDIHATDVQYIRSLQVDGLSFSNANLKKIGIPVALPDDRTQAQVMLLMVGQGNDSLKYEAAISDFISKFPTLTDGYMAKAQELVRTGNFSDAARTMEEAIKKVESKDDAHFNYGKLIYNKVVYDNRPYDEWNIDKAMEQVDIAYGISQLPLYKHLQAQINFTKGEYQKAYDTFMELSNNKEFSGGEVLYESARCKQMMGAPDEEILVLLDSAINVTDTLRMNEAAPYFFARGETYDRMGKYREAVFDYTRYELLSSQRPNAQFYYLREQVEVKGRLYQQAVGDIARAIILAPDEPLYIAEMASLQLRINDVEKALQASQRCVEIAPEYGTGHLLYGLALIKSDKKEEGLAELRKAKELGEEQADALIEKYSK